MPDVDIIRDNYASMPDEKLILIAKEDSPDLTDEAFVILNAEFAKRRLDINAYLPSVFESKPFKGDVSASILTFLFPFNTYFQPSSLCIEK